MNRPELTDEEWERLAEVFGSELLNERPDMTPALLRYLEENE
ncbi:hypothetical protein [Rhizobium ruizarguesonis]|nr:hypothetical protein [Rhizobium ruizarguesonis]